jgi:hypothetical protein
MSEEDAVRVILAFLIGYLGMTLLLKTISFLAQ